MKNLPKQTAFTCITVALFLSLFFLHTTAQEQNEPCEQSCADSRDKDYRQSTQETGSDPPIYGEATCIHLYGVHCTGITVDMNGCLYAAGENTLIIFDTDGSLKKKVDLEGEATCIASDQRGLLYLGLVEHVEVYNTDGEQRDIWVSLGSNAVVTSIAVSSDMVYVADAGNRLVMGFSKTGKLETIIGGTNKSVPGFIIPSPYFDVAIGPDDTLWAANTGRRRLENYTPEGIMISSWGESSVDIEGFCGCCNPSHFALLPDGSFVTSEKGIPRVKVYSPSGQFEGVVAGPDQFGTSTVGLDIAVNRWSEILILDPNKGCVRVFQKK